MEKIPPGLKAEVMVIITGQAAEAAMMARAEISISAPPMDR
jgi:hypothetical protein